MKDRLRKEREPLDPVKLLKELREAQAELAALNGVVAQLASRPELPSRWTSFRP
mgnify:CR=1 FL=1